LAFVSSRVDLVNNKVEITGANKPILSIIKKTERRDKKQAACGFV